MLRPPKIRAGHPTFYDFDTYGDLTNEEEPTNVDYTDGEYLPGYTPKLQATFKAQQGIDGSQDE